MSLKTKMMTGTAFGVHRWRRNGEWGILLLLLTIASTVLALPHSFPLAFPFSLALSALLGAASHKWLSQPRAWACGQCVMWAEHAWTALLSLALVWLLPSSQSLILLGFACLSPLLLIDALESKKRGEAISPATQTDRTHSPALALLTLSCIFTTLQAALWSTIGIAFVAHLKVEHGLSLLPWLLGGQVSAWIVVCVIHRSFARVQALPWVLLPLLLLVAGGIAALAILNSPFLLALCVAGCTLGNLLWEDLLPVWVRPSAGETGCQPGTTLETVVTALLALALGITTDWFSISVVLTMVSVCLATVLFLAAWDICRQPHHPLAVRGRERPVPQKGRKHDLFHKKRAMRAASGSRSQWKGSPGVAEVKQSRMRLR